MHQFPAPPRAVASILASFAASAALTFAVAGALHVGPTGAVAGPSASLEATTTQAPPSSATLASFPALAHPDPAVARAIDKPNAVAFYTANEAGLNVDGAAVLTDTAALSLVLLPKAGGQLCLMRLPASGASTDNCVDEAVASRSGIVNGTPGHVFGVVPAGVDAVRFVLADGSVVQVTPAASGYFEAPSEAIGGTFTHRGTVESLGELIPGSRTPLGMIVSK